MLKTLAAGEAIQQRQIDLDKLLPCFDVSRIRQPNDQTSSCIGNCAHRHAADLARGYILTHTAAWNLSREEVQKRRILEDNVADGEFSGNSLNSLLSHPR